MEQEREKAVWQRVAAKAAVPAGEVYAPLIRESAELSAAYRSLAGHPGGKEQALARRLLEREQSAAAMLRAMAALTGEAAEQVKLWPGEKQEPRQLLKRCFCRVRRCREEYMARCLDPEFGDVFRLLAEQAEHQRAGILDLLGRL